MAANGAVGGWIEKYSFVFISFSSRRRPTDTIMQRSIFLDLSVLVDLSEVRRAAFVAAFNAHARGLPAPLAQTAWSPMSELKLDGLAPAAQLLALRAAHPALALDEPAFYAALDAEVLAGAGALQLPARPREALAYLAPRARALTLATVDGAPLASAPALLPLASAVVAALGLPAGQLALGGGSGAPAPAAGDLVLLPAAAARAHGAAEPLAAAGVELFTVLDALDFTPALLARALAGRGAVEPLIPRLRIVVPMAGLGSRFTADGFTIQKPFLPTIEGVQLWEAVVENLMPKEEPLRSATEVHVVVRADQVHLFSPPPHITMHTVAALTEGPACTVLSVAALIDDDVPLMIGNSDQFLEWDADAFYAAAFHPDYDGAISTFVHPRPDDLKWSYAALHPASGAIATVAEKVYVGPYATTGLYAWKRGRDFCAHARAMIAANLRVNNEFYVCPVYNSAIAGGLRYRTVNCERFWGVGVPVDYAAWLDRYVPPGPPLGFHEALARKYAAVWCKWGSRVPAPMPNFTADPALCACMWSTGAFHTGPALAELRAALAPWASKCEWFEEEKGSGLGEGGGGAGGGSPVRSYAAAAARPRAVLHHTFFQFQTFPVDPLAAGAEGALLPSLHAWAAAAKGALAELPPYYLTLTGVSPVRSGVVACGYPPRDYLPARAAIRAAAPCKEPHAQDIHHVTLLRWTAPLTPSENAAVGAVLARFRDAPLGMFQPSQWHVGLATWHVRPESCKPVVSWRAPPAPWVLHRGNTAGLNPAGENVPSALRARLEEGWDVEIDLWRCSLSEAVALAKSAAAAGHGAGGEALAALEAAHAAASPAARERPALFLGHDAPTHPLEREEEGPGGLLGAPGVWIHCKNLGAWAHLRRHPRAPAFNFFLHDKDEAALTSQGYAWGYPEVPVPGPGVVSVVWPHKRSHAVRPGVGVCWDWLPKDVTLEY